MLKIIEAKPLENYRIWLKYDDGQEGIVDLSHFVGKGIFTLWDDGESFFKVEIEAGRELVWSDQVALCADALYLELTGQEPEDLFPSLAPESSHAGN